MAFKIQSEAEKTWEKSCFKNWLVYQDWDFILVFSI